MDYLATLTSMWPHMVDFFIGGLCLGYLIGRITESFNRLAEELEEAKQTIKRLKDYL